jgi:hypothetical protein
MTVTVTTTRRWSKIQRNRNALNEILAVLATTLLSSAQSAMCFCATIKEGFQTVKKLVGIYGIPLWTLRKEQKPYVILKIRETMAGLQSPRKEVLHFKKEASVEHRSQL